MFLSLKKIQIIQNTYSKKIFQLVKSSIFCEFFNRQDFRSSPSKERSGASSAQSGSMFFWPFTARVHVILSRANVCGSTFTDHDFQSRRETMNSMVLSILLSLHTRLKESMNLYFRR